MTDSSQWNSQLNKIVLKPRFSFKYEGVKDDVLDRFQSAFAKKGARFRGKVAGDHIFIDVPAIDEHFWSPHLEIELEEHNGNLEVKGLFGPKPQLWTLFMFIHFGVALAFAVFATMLYTDWSLHKDYTLSLSLTIAMPILWILFYLFGRWGKKKGRQQMVALDGFMREVLNHQQ